MNWGVVAVAIIKNEGDYLREWLIFHMALGVDYFWLYDNDSSDNTKEVLRPFIANGRASLLNWPVRAGQIDAYNHAATILAQNADWLGFWDIDEFLVLHHHHRLLDFLEDVGADQVLVPWRNFPYGGHRSKPGGATFQNFFWAHALPAEGVVQVKHFARAKTIRHVTAHYSYLFDGGKTYIADGTGVDAPGPRVFKPSYKRAQFNHYATRSLFENEHRLKNGQVDGEASKVIAQFIPMTKDLAAVMEYDDSALRHSMSYSIENAKWDRVSSFPHRFGAEQSKPVLFSWIPTLWYFAKSFGNYKLAEDVVRAGTAFTFQSGLRDDGSQTNVVTDFGGPSVIFESGPPNHLNYFQGTVHFGDFTRRFTYRTRHSQREIAIDGAWSCTACCSGASTFMIFDAIVESHLEIVLLISGQEILRRQVPPGRFAGAFYHTISVERDAHLHVSFTGSAAIRELILGDLP